MDYSERDIESLDKIIDALTKDSIGTVPEILYGHGTFPTFNSPKDLDCRMYEDILIDNDICSVTDDWTPNSIPGGYKLIYLDRGGREIVRLKKSVRDFLEQKEKDNILLVPTIYIGGNAIFGNNNSGNNQGNDFGNLSQSKND